MVHFGGTMSKDAVRELRLPDLRRKGALVSWVHDHGVLIIHVCEELSLFNQLSEPHIFATWKMPLQFKVTASKS
jgi:hypothetical protein